MHTDQLNQWDSQEGAFFLKPWDCPYILPNCIFTSFLDLLTNINKNSKLLYSWGDSGKA